MKGKCFKCKRPAKFEWRICSDGPWRKVCTVCDLNLNLMALKWAYPRSWAKKFNAYKAKVSSS